MILFRPDCMDQSLIEGKVSSSHGDGIGGIQMSASCAGGSWFSYVVSPTSSAQGHEGEYEVMMLHYPLAPDETTLVDVDTDTAITGPSPPPWVVAARRSP